MASLNLWRPAIQWKIIEFPLTILPLKCLLRMLSKTKLWTGGLWDALCMSWWLESHLSLTRIDFVCSTRLRTVLSASQGKTSFPFLTIAKTLFCSCFTRAEKLDLELKVVLLKCLDTHSSGQFLKMPYLIWLSSLHLSLKLMIVWSILTRD